MGYVSAFLKQVRKTTENFAGALRKALNQLKKELMKDGEHRESL